MAVYVPLVMSSGLSSSIAEVAAMSNSAFYKSEEDEEVEESLDFDSESEDTEDEGHTTEDEDPAARDEGLATGDEGPDIRVESRGLDDESRGLDDEGHSLESDGFGLGDEDAITEGQQRAVLVVGTAVSESSGLSMFEVGQGSGSAPEPERSERVSVSSTYIVLSPIPSPMISLTVPSPIASPVATSTATIPVDEDHFIEVGAQLELYRSILQDHTQRLDAMPPTLFVEIDKDARELYTRSRAVRDEILS
nr:hypothetical protein [Tanacetum cinerariifolium]